MTDTITREEEALRRAVHAADFAAAERAAGCYAGALRILLPRLAPADAARRLGHACRLMEWARRCLCASRARLAGELREIERLAAWRQAAATAGAVHTWRIDG